MLWEAESEEDKFTHHYFRCIYESCYKSLGFYELYLAPFFVLSIVIGVLILYLPYWTLSKG